MTVVDYWTEINWPLGCISTCQSNQICELKPNTYILFIEYRYQHKLCEAITGNIVYRIFLQVDVSLVIVEWRRYCFLGS